MPVNCLELSESDITVVIRGVLYEFPLQELDLFLPRWVDTLPGNHPLKAELYQAVQEQTRNLGHIRELSGAIRKIGEAEHVSKAEIKSINLGIGIAEAELEVPRGLFYATLKQQSGFDIADDGDLIDSVARYENPVSMRIRLVLSYAVLFLEIGFSVWPVIKRHHPLLHTVV